MRDNVLFHPTRTRAASVPVSSCGNPLTDLDCKAGQVHAFLQSVKLDEGFTHADLMHWGRDLIWEYVVALAVQGDDASPPLPTNGASAILLFLAFCQHTDEAKEGDDRIIDGGTVRCGYEHVMTWVSDQLHTQTDS